MPTPLTILFTALLLQSKIFLPIGTTNRQDISQIHLTKIGAFGLVRKGRPNIPEHYHTGIDIRRPNKNYGAEPIYPISEGIVISKRTDGPYANLIIQHEINGMKVWSLYEHIAGVRVNVADKVNPNNPIARFMNKEELDKHGWQFDHFHFELLKVKPINIKPSQKNPERFFNSYSLICYSIHDLNKYYFDPMEYFNSKLHQ